MLLLNLRSAAFCEYCTVRILKFLGLAPTEDDKRLQELVQNTYKSVRVIGRGTVRIDPKEVRESAEFQKALSDAREIVNR